MKLAVVGVVLSGLLAAIGLTRTQNTAYRDRLDVFVDLLNSPLTYLFPLAAALISVGPVYVRLRVRFLSLRRIRGDLDRTVWQFFGSAAAVALVFGFTLVIWPGLIAFGLWPQLGDPNLFPSDYGLTAESAALDALQRTSYSQLLAGGEVAYVLAYAAIVGVSAAAFAVIAVAGMLLSPSLAGAILAPWIGFLAWTVVASLLGAPRFALIYAIFPFGLVQAPIAESLTPAMVMCALALALAATAYSRRGASPWAS